MGSGIPFARLADVLGYNQSAVKLEEKASA